MTVSKKQSWILWPGECHAGISISRLFLFSIDNTFSLAPRTDIPIIWFCFHFACLCKWYRHFFIIYFLFCFLFHTRATKKKVCIQNNKFVRVGVRCRETHSEALLIIILIYTGINICMNIIAINLRPPLSILARAKLILLDSHSSDVCSLQFAYIFLYSELHSICRWQLFMIN